MATIKQWLMMAGLLAIVILAMHFYYAPKVASLQQQVIELKLQNQGEIIKKLQEIAKTRRDSVWFFKKEVIKYENVQEEEQNVVDHVHSADSLIELYYDEKSNLLSGSVEYNLRN
jgi:hypothetical protein